MSAVRHPGYAAWKFSRNEIRTILDKLIPGLAAAREALRADCLLVSGTSGSWLGASLVLHQELPVILVRKPSENSHGYNVEGPNGGFERGIFIDDLVATGGTVRNVVRALDNAGTGISVVGVVVYKPDSDGDTVLVKDAYIPVRQWGWGFTAGQEPYRPSSYTAQVADYYADTITF